MGYKVIQDSIVGVLRGSAISGIDWGSTASPYYEQVPEPAPAYPYLVFEVDDSSMEWHTELAYSEMYVATFHLICLEDDVASLGSPYETTSPFNYLDGKADELTVYDGDGFNVQEFHRTSWALKMLKDYRGPGGERVYDVQARYGIMVNPNSIAGS